MSIDCRSHCLSVREPLLSPWTEALHPVQNDSKLVYMISFFRWSWTCATHELHCCHHSLCLPSLHLWLRSWKHWFCRIRKKKLEIYLMSSCFFSLSHWIIGHLLVNHCNIWKWYMQATVCEYWILYFEEKVSMVHWMVSIWSELFSVNLCPLINSWSELYCVNFFSSYLG
jgi:hypothetical protein